MSSSFHSELIRAAKAIAAADDVALACHITPDGDALGSMLGFLHLCRGAGTSAVASWPEPSGLSNHYRSIPGAELAVPSARFPAQPPLMVTFDCGSLQRLHELGRPAMWARDHGDLVVIDHHATNDRYGSINPIDEGAAATAVVVRALAAELGWELNRDAAWCLYVALVTDTGRFQYASTTPAVFALAQELASFDLPIARISRELFEEHRFAYLQLAGSVLQAAVLERGPGDLGLVHAVVSAADLARFGVDYQEIEGLIDWVRTAADAEVACLLKQAPDGFRVSLRSVSAVDVGAVAAALGGGGHRLAAGFTRDAPAHEILDAVRMALQAELARAGLDGRTP